MVHHLMKNFSLIVAFLALARATFAADAPGENSGLKLSLRFPTNIFMCGTPIHMTAVLENTTTNSMTIPFVRNSAVEIIILDPRKELLSPTNRSIWHSVSGPSSVMLPAKDRREFQFDLTDIFDLSFPGKYCLQARGVRFRGPWEKLPPVESAINEITIVPTQK
jgi:hypothetical protein